MQEKLPPRKKYDRNCFYWALMYRKGVVSLHPREDEPRREALFANRRWEKEFGKSPWHVKRFKFYFRGTIIDGYEHWWMRNEIPSASINGSERPTNA